MMAVKVERFFPSCMWGRADFSSLFLHGMLRKEPEAKAEMRWTFYHQDDLFVSSLLSGSAPCVHTARVQCECST